MTHLSNTGGRVAMCVNKFNKTMCHALNNTIHISKKCGWQTLKAFNQSDFDDKAISLAFVAGIKSFKGDIGFQTS